MPKTILVIDVSTLDDGRHLCNECPIWNKERLFCEYDFNMKAKGCPLRPLPKKMNETEYMQKVNSDGDWYEQVVGWNACLDAITGETE